MGTEKDDRTYTQAAMRKLHEIEAQELLDRVRAYTFGCLHTAATEQERQHYRDHLAHWFGLEAQEIAEEAARWEAYMRHLEQRYPAPAPGEE